MLEARVDQKNVPAVYARVSPIYDIWGNLFEKKARQVCLEWAQITDGEKILEVAVGTGLTFREILKQNPRGHNEGIDLTAAMLARAEAKAQKMGAKNYHLQVGSAHHLPFPAETFDLLINNYMFDLLPEQDFMKVLAEFKRVLRPGGRMVLVNLAHMDNLSSRFWDAVYKIFPNLMGGCRGVNLESFVEKTGFASIKRTDFTQFTLPSEVILALRNAS